MIGHLTDFYKKKKQKKQQQQPSAMEKNKMIFEIIVWKEKEIQYDCINRIYLNFFAWFSWYICSTVNQWSFGCLIIKNLCWHVFILPVVFRELETNFFSLPNIYVKSFLLDVKFIYKYR